MRRSPFRCLRERLPGVHLRASLPEGWKPDGDTLHAGIDLGMYIAVNTTIRFYGCNAPELPTAAGKASLAWVCSGSPQTAVTGSSCCKR